MRFLLWKGGLCREPRRACRETQPLQSTPTWRPVRVQMGPVTGATVSWIMSSQPAALPCAPWACGTWVPEEQSGLPSPQRGDVGGGLLAARGASPALAAVGPRGTFCPSVGKMLFLGSPPGSALCFPSGVRTDTTPWSSISRSAKPCDLVVTDGVSRSGSRREGRAVAGCLLPWPPATLSLSPFRSCSGLPATPVTRL